MKKFGKIDFIYINSLERPKPVEIYNDKYGWMNLVFDDLSEEKATEVMIKFLREGMPETRIVDKTPKFLSIVF